MRKLLLLLLLALPLWGQAPTITELSCAVTDRSAIITWKTSITSGDATRIAYDYDDVSLDRRTPQKNSQGANSGWRQFHIYDLNPDDDVYFSDLSSNAAKTTWADPICPTTCTNCGSSDYSVFANNSNCNCGGIGEHPSFHTATEDTDPDPDPPTSNALTTPPAITGGGGHTYTVDSGCANFAGQKAAADSDASDGDTVELVLPAGEACGTTGFNIPANASGGWVVVRSSADPKLLPPEGAMVDKTYLPFLATITASAMGQWGYGDQIFTSSNSGRGYYFWGVNIEPLQLGSSAMTPIDYAITAINTSTDTLTVASTAGLSTGNAGEVIVVDLTGSGVLGGYGVMQTASVTGTTLKLATGCSSKGFCSATVDLTGSNCSGSCGTIRRMIAVPIEAHTSNGGNHALTITGHSLPNYPNATITGSPGSTQITISAAASGYQIGTSSQGNSLGSAIHIEGTGVGNCDNLWNVSSISGGTTITLSRTGVTPNCTGATSGTAHAHRAISVFRTSSDTIGDQEPRAFNYEKIDADTIELLETAAVGGVTGGYLFWDTEAINGIALGTSATSAARTDITFDRVIFQACLPWQSLGLFSLGHVRDTAIVNSWVDSCAWRRTNPVNNKQERVHGVFQSHQTFSLQDNQRVIIRNNYLSPSPQIYLDDSNDPEGTSNPETVSSNDIFAGGNYFWNPDWAFSSSNTAQARNHHFERAFSMEWKSIRERLAIVGNYFKGWTSNFQATQPAITVPHGGSSGNGPTMSNGASHVDITSNIFERGGSILQVPLDYSSYGTEKMRSELAKWRFSNNLAVNIDSVRYNDFGSSAVGQLLVLTTGFRDFVASNNTYIPQRAVSSNVLALGGTRGSGMRFTDNILGFTGGINVASMGVTQTDAQMLPATTASGGYDAFQEHFIRGTTFDSGTSEVTGNIGIPMLKAPSTSGSYADRILSTSASDAYCVASLTAISSASNFPDPTGIAWIGDTGACPSTVAETVKARLDAVFDPGTYSPISPTYDGEGANLTTLSDGQGFCGPVTVSATSTTFTLTFHAATTAEVTVDRAPWAGTWATTWDAAGDITRGQTANGATQSKTFTASGLTAATQYAYRVHGGGCGKVLIGTVTTAGS